MGGNGRDPQPPPAGVQDILDELHAVAFTHPADVQEYMSRRVAEYNATPQEELGGLSPQQALVLLHGDWEGNGAVRLNASLSLADLERVEILVNARRFLAAVDDMGGAKATQAGNLARVVVAQLAEALTWEADLSQALRESDKPLNEQDFVPLHILRVVLELAGLLRKAKARFGVTRRGRALLADAQAGELYVLLFRTFFRKLNLDYLSRFGEHRAIQQTVAFTLYRLAADAAAWTRTAELAHRIVLPDVARDVPVDAYGIDRLAWAVESRVLDPLVRFGLLEGRELPGKDKYIPIREVRRTPLYGRFLRFEP